MDTHGTSYMVRPGQSLHAKSRCRGTCNLLNKLYDIIQQQNAVFSDSCMGYKGGDIAENAYFWVEF